MGTKPPPESTADKAPGAAAALLRQLPVAGGSSTPAAAQSSSPPAVDSSPLPSSSSRDTVADDWAAVCQQLARPPVLDVASPDQLLERGIGDYTVLDDVPILGKGKFSVVYRAEKAGREYAIKHTPLHPHHPLIATRLIREPELLAKLEPHPNLIRVFETIRTEGHFYLVEEYLPTHISLDALCLRFPHQRLPFALVVKILQQLVSVVRDGLHQHSVCHRDIKPENILIEPETGHITLIDMGLATHFSQSSAKLSTCCGSPAFHSPEIVLSLSRPAGEVRYFGPEIDIWCIALSALRCWTGRRYPIGTGHKSLAVMRGRVDDLLALISRDVMDDGSGAGGDDRRADERVLRETLRSLLDLDTGRRMQAFRDFDVGDEVRDSVAHFQRVREFKQTTFQLTAPKYVLPLQLATEPLPPMPVVLPAPTTLEPPTSSTLVLRNPTDQHPVKVVSFLKYALRCANIIYHCRSTEVHALSAPGTPIRPVLTYFPEMGPAAPAPMSPVPDLIPSLAPPGSMTILQCIATLPALPSPPPPPPTPLEPLPKERRPFLPSLFRSSSSTSSVRSASTPPIKRSPPSEAAEQQRRSASGSRTKDGKEAQRYVVFFVALRFSSPSAAAVAEERRQRRQRSASRRGSSRSRASSRAPPPAGSATAGQDLIFEEVSTRLNDSHGERRQPHSRQTSFSGLSSLHPQEAAATVSRHTSIRRDRSASGSTSTGSASTNSTPPVSPALESFKSLASEGPQVGSKRSMTVRPSSRIRSLSTAGGGARAPSLSRSSASSSYGHSHLPWFHHPAHLTESVVLVHVSDPLALPALQAAFTIAPPTPSTDAGTPLVSPAPLASSLQESPTAIAIPPQPLPVAGRLSTQRQKSSLNEDDEDDEPRRGRSEARSADSFSSSTSGGSGGRLAKAINAHRLRLSTPMPARTASRDDRTPTATPAPTDRQRQPQAPSSVGTPPTPSADVHGPRLGSVSSEGSNEDGPLATPGADDAALDPTRIVDARKNSSASSIGELFEGLGLRGMTADAAAAAGRRAKSPAVRSWGWGDARHVSERSRSVGLFDR